MAAINGTPGKDTLIGTDLGETISGFGGDDGIDGGDGDDSIAVFGDGRLNISGGAGNGTIQVAFIGADAVISGGDGIDRLTFDAGNGVDDLDLTGVAISGDFEIIVSAGQGM